MTPDLASAAASVILPRERVRPSDWAAANIRLTSRQGARPGPFDPGWKPWTRAVLDAHYDHPGKLGIIGIKRSQVGWSTIAAIVMLHFCDIEPGPILYITTDRDNAGKFVDEYFDEFLRGVPRLAESFRLAGKDKRETVLERPYLGGRVDFFGAGSETGAISLPRLLSIVDEYEKSDKNFPQGSGDLFTTVSQRHKTYRDAGRGWQIVQGHPRFEGEDIHLLWDVQSTRGRWVFDCPHCGGTVEPCFARLKFDGVDGTGEEMRVDPATAKFMCPHCDRQITDGERAKAVWPPDRGGTGRLESDLPPEEEAKRPYLGINVNGLADPDVSVYEIARQYADCRDEEQFQSFFNKTLGEPRRRVREYLTLEHVRELHERRPEDQRRGGLILPGGPYGVRLLCTGADVQKPRHNPMIYATAVAYAADGRAYVVDVQRVLGWSAYNAWLMGLTVRIDNGPYGGQMDTLGVKVATIDTGFEGPQVLDNCRDPALLYSAAGSTIKRLPVKFQAMLNSDNPAVLPPVGKRLKPGMEHLGPIDYYWLHRHSWYDRAIRRVQAKRITWLCDLPDNYWEQIKSNQLVPVPKQHGMQREEEVWKLAKGCRDDYLASLVYAEAGAVLAGNLDRMHHSAAMEMARQEAVANRTAAPATAQAERPATDWRPDAGPTFGRDWFDGGGVGSNWF